MRLDPVLGRKLYLLGMLVALGPLGIDMYLPAFTKIQESLGAHAQLTLSSFFLGLVGGQIVFGALSDRFGRRPPLLWGVVIYLLATVLCATATRMPTLIVARFLQGIGACSGMVLSRAIVRDLTSGIMAALAQARLMLIMGAAPILAPSLGTLCMHLGSWRTIFVIQALLALTVLIWTWFELEETHPPHPSIPQHQPLLSAMYALFQQRNFMLLTLTSNALMSGMFCYIATTPGLLMHTFHVSADHYALIFSANGAAFIATTQVNARLLHIHGIQNIMHRALVLPVIAASFLLIMLLTHQLGLISLCLGLWVYIASLGFLVPNASAAALSSVGTHIAGTASSLMGTLQYLSAALATVLVTLGDPHAPNALIIGLCLSATLALSLFRLGHPTVH